MGISKCSQYCETGLSEKVGCNGSWASEDHTAAQFSWAEPQAVLPPTGNKGGFGSFSAGAAVNLNQDQEISSLSYNPPPPPEHGKDVEALLGTPMPARPRAQRDNPQSSPHKSASSQPGKNGGRTQAVSYARPGEPVNKVYVQFSNDLEGFLPYTLVISEAQGLEFTSVCSSPDFTIDPLSIMKVSRVDFDTLIKDSFFSSLSKSIRQRISSGSVNNMDRGGWPAHPLEERVQPPYHAIVQLSVRRTLLDGCQVIVFITVQSDPLAEELVQSCHKLKKRRAMRVPNDDPVRVEMSSRSVSRGCPSPRTAASAAAGIQTSAPRSSPPAARDASPVAQRLASSQAPGTRS